MAAYDLTITILYIHSILYNLNTPQIAVSVIGKDNDKCTTMANAGKPTFCNQHIHIKYFSLCEWVEGDLLVLEQVLTAQNT